MKTLKIIAFIKVYALVALVLTSMNSNFNKNQEAENITVIKTKDDLVLNKIKQSHFGYIKLQVTNGVSNYDTDFYFNSNATTGLDPGYDAAINGSIPDLAIYSYLVQDSNGIAFAIQALSDINMQNITIPLGINLSQGQEITFSILETDIPDSIDVFLEDINNSSITLLNSNDYTFIPNSNLAGSGHFFLKFQSNILSEIESVKNNIDIAYSYNEKAITINGQLTSETTMRVYDINGSVLTSKTLNVSNNKKHSIDVAYLSTGIYIVELKSNSIYKSVEKVVVR